MIFSFLLLGGLVFVAGFIDAIAGGGGLITLPALLLCGVPTELVLGTNKFVGTVGTFFSTARYCFSKRVVWKVCCVGAVFSLFGSSCAAHTVSQLPASSIARVIMILLPLATASVLLPKKKTSMTLHSHRSWLFFLLVPLITFTLGAYDGGFGPGTGTFLVLAFHGLLHLPLLQAAATARVFNLLSNIGALSTFMLLGKVDYKTALPLCVFGIAGHWCGAHTALKRGDHFVRHMLLASTGLLFVALLLKYFW